MTVAMGGLVALGRPLQCDVNSGFRERAASCALAVRRPGLLAPTGLVPAGGLRACWAA